MAQLISLNIYRTENITFSGTQYTIRFASSKDDEKHALMVSNNSTNQQTKYHFSSEVASDFEHYHNEKLKSRITSPSKRPPSRRLMVVLVNRMLRIIL